MVPSFSYFEVILTVFFNGPRMLISSSSILLSSSSVLWVDLSVAVAKAPQHRINSKHSWDSALQVVESEGNPGCRTGP